jgi:hypothetical protein
MERETRMENWSQKSVWNSQLVIVSDRHSLLYVLEVVESKNLSLPFHSGIDACFQVTGAAASFIRSPTSAMTTDLASLQKGDDFMNLQPPV